MSSRALWAAAALAVAICFVGLGRSLWSPDEPTVAAIGRAMLDSGDLVVPRLNGQPFLEKPPLYWWVEVASMRVLGVDPAAARLPSALFALGTLVVAWLLGRRAGVQPPLLVPLVLASTALFAFESARVEVDPALAFFVAGAHWGFTLLAAPRDRRDRVRGMVVVALALPLAFLVKGPIALVLGAGPPVLFLLVTRRRRAIRELLPPLALALPLFALVVLPWVLALANRAGTSALQEVLVNNTLGRAMSETRTIVYGHRQPFWYYLQVAPAILLPWSLAIPAALAAGLLRGGGEARGEARRLLAWTPLIGVLLLSFAATKRELYLLPLLPAFATAIAWWLGEASRAANPARWRRTTVVSLLAIAVLLPLVAIGALAFTRDPRTQAHGLPLAPVRAEMTTGCLVGCVLLLLVVLASAALPLRRLLVKRALPAMAATLLPMLLLMLALLRLQALFDPVKRLDDLTTAIARLAPGEAPVPAYVGNRGSHEALVGIIGFELGRRTTTLETVGELDAQLAQHPGAPVVVRVEDLHALPPTLRAPRLLYDESGRKALPYALAVWVTGSRPPAPSSTPSR